MVTPITPAEVRKLRQSTIPDEIIEAFNECITKNYKDGAARVNQDDVIKIILSKIPNVSRNEIFENGWLDIEQSYKGWKVSYLKQQSGDTTPSYFLFVAIPL